MGWLREYLDSVHAEVGDFEETPLGYFTTDEYTVIKNIWRSIKSRAKGRKIFLTGRMWIFEVLARRENYPTVYWNLGGTLPLDSTSSTIGYGKFGKSLFSISEYFPNLKDVFAVFKLSLKEKISACPSDKISIARLAIELYKNEAPKFIDARNPLTFTERVVRRLAGDENVKL